MLETKEELLSCLESDGIILTAEESIKARDNDGEMLCDIGNKYYANEKYTKAFNWYQPAAAQNNSYAQYRIGCMHYCAEDVSQDDQSAMEWFLKAVNNDGNKKAQSMIGDMYRYGDGVCKNIHTAIEWYTKAANQGYSFAQFSLGVIYEEQVKDLKEAFSWYKKAADNGSYVAKDCIKRLNEQGYFP